MPPLIHTGLLLLLRLSASHRPVTARLSPLSTVGLTHFLHWWAQVKGPRRAHIAHKHTLGTYDRMR